MSRTQGAVDGSDYVRVLTYLAGIACPACKGIGGKGSKGCKFCKETGFRDGDIHLLVSSKQIRRR